MRQGIALLLTLGIGLAGYAVMGYGTTDDGPRGERWRRVGLAMILFSGGFAAVGAFVAWRLQ